VVVTGNDSVAAPGSSGAHNAKQAAPAISGNVTNRIATERQETRPEPVPYGVPYVLVRDRESQRAIAQATVYLVDQGRWDSKRWKAIRSTQEKRVIGETPESIQRAMAKHFGAVLVTDDQGRAAIPELKGPTSLDCFHDGKHGMAVLMPESWAAGRSDAEPTLIFREKRLEYPLWLEAPSSFDARLLDSRGKPIASAEIDLIFGDDPGQRIRLRTNDEGRCTFTQLRRAMRQSKKRPWILRPVVLGGSPVHKAIHPEQLQDTEQVLRLPPVGELLLRCYATRRGDARGKAQVLLQTLSQPGIEALEFTVDEIEHFALVRLDQRFALHGELSNGEPLEQLSFDGPKEPNERRVLRLRPLSEGGLTLHGQLRDETGLPATGRLSWRLRGEDGKALGGRQPLRVRFDSGFRIAVSERYRARMRAVEFVSAGSDESPAQAMQVPAIDPPHRPRQLALGRIVLQRLPVIAAGVARTAQGAPLFGGDLAAQSVQRDAAGKIELLPVPGCWARQEIDGSFAIHASCRATSARSRSRCAARHSRSIPSAARRAPATSCSSANVEAGSACASRARVLPRGGSWRASTRITAIPRPSPASGAASHKRPMSTSAA
jgi:hypothetical protein